MGRTLTADREIVTRADDFAFGLIGSIVQYRADAAPDEWADEHLGGWKPSIHMPRWASRITLEVVSVRCERLQEITLEDAIAEGAGWMPDPSPVEPDEDPREVGYPSAAALAAHEKRWPLDRFRHGWDALNAKRGYGWDANSWVFVVEFKMVT